ncbi:hypothetical protein C2845_PM02G00900 [Panicum miliaceum]|uniref:Zinc-finger domain-containing protein n=1 Tax=Panicum miliaceum TaxID=4540 RepID=A0A3L6S939_PANMI|nr:hypothetical protein C2845_PM02G00900 [Panicum miliaceum]
MGKLSAKSDYECLRDARISENMARMEMLGLLRCAGELSDIASASSHRAAGSATPRNRKPPRPRVMSMTPLRRSSRRDADWVHVDELPPHPIERAVCSAQGAASQRSLAEFAALPWILAVFFFCRLVGALSKLAAAAAAETDEDDDEENLALLVDKKRVQALQERRCDSKGRGGVYDPVLGICCHFCRQKKLCSEEDCKRCGEGDLKQPCLGKTECSSCHSSNGILCRAWLKVRYGEAMEEVRENKN